MGVHTFTVVDTTSTVAPARLFKGMCLDNHNLLPKVVPHAIKSIDFVEGDSVAVGCVKQYNFTEVSPFKYAKAKVNELDVDNCYYKYTVFEGGHLFDDVLDCVVYEVKVEPSSSGSHYKMTGHFHTKDNAVFTEDDVKPGLQNLQLTFKKAEEYLINNPQAYA